MKRLKYILFICCISVLIVLCNQANPRERAPSGSARLKHYELMLKFMQGVPFSGCSTAWNDPGPAVILDYTRYGKFIDVGTNRYQYAITDIGALKNDIGPGIYPNEEFIFTVSKYKSLRKKWFLKESRWNIGNREDKRQAIYIWAKESVDPGARTFFTARLLEDAGFIPEALRAYYAVLVHFPRSAAWSMDKSFIWYLAPTAIGDIRRLCDNYPCLECEFKGAFFAISNGEDNDLSNDVIKFNPGKIIRKALKQKLAELPDLSGFKIVQTRGQGKVKLVKYANGHWQMLVDGEPFFIRGISYHPTEIGLSPDREPNCLDKWMFADKDRNGLIDAPYDAWVDKNGNGIQDADEPPVGDFQLLKDMGVNVIRWFSPNSPPDKYDPAMVNKELLRDLSKRFGIRVAVVDFLGAYTRGSGADWLKGTDYTDPQQRRKMKEVVRRKVLDLKDEPFVLIWVLGNENNFREDYSGLNATRTNAAAQPRAYARFLNEVAVMIHELDPDHPVAVGNLELGLANYYDRLAPAIDIFAVNSYRGEGFGTLFQDAKRMFDRPVLIAEYGCDAYAEGKGVDEAAQAKIHSGNLRDIVLNQAGGPCVGNSIGGIIFEYLDEWWKAPDDRPDQHSLKSQGQSASDDGWAHEEWMGVAGQGSGKNSPFERRLRKAYYLYKQW